ncbi:MAG: efflux RND transporter periplasmic adaptor subunit, partial [Gemmatimonadota bacterium]
LQAQRDAERFQALEKAGTNYVTDTEVEQAVTQAEVQRALWRSAEHGVAQARAGLAQARDQLDKTVIRAPIAGRVTRLNVERGETAIVGTMNNPGSLLLTVADLSVMEAVIEVDETDVPDISTGDSAWVEIDAFPNRRFAGRVTKIGNSSIQGISATASATNQAIDFEVRITLDDPPPEIRPDLSATADVITDTREQVVAIPITALTLMDAEEVERLPNEALPDTARGPATRDIEGVFIVEGERVRFQPVQIGIAGESHFEVLSGIEPGQTVVSGSFQAIRELQDGDRVEITQADSSAAGPATAADGDQGSS